MFKTHVNTIGVVFAGVGSVLLWKYIGDVVYSDKDEFLKGNSTLMIHDATHEAISKLKWSIRLSRFGIGLIIAGSALQIASNYFPE